MERVLRIGFGSVLALTLFLPIDRAFSEEMKELPEVVVTAPLIPTKEATETVYTGYEITEKGLKLKGEKGYTNLWDQISTLPGVIFQSTDPGNLMFRGSVRVRGIDGSLGTMTVEGVPIYGGNPIGPRPNIVDLENFKSLALYKGSIPIELGTGVGTRGGVIALRPRWAEEKPGIVLKGDLGNHDYWRTYLRVDSGKIGPFETRFSISGSYAEEDKWKGKGEIGPRKNLNFTLVQPISERITFKLWSNYNKIDQYNYRSLSYAQAKDEDNYYHYDYNKEFTGNPQIDWQYYKFYKTIWENEDIYGFVDIKGTDWLKLEIKPYWRRERKGDWSGSKSVIGFKASKPGVTLSTWTADRYGAIAQAVFEYKWLKAVLGYHYEENKWKDSISKNYWLNKDGSLTFVGWGRFTKSEDPTVTQSPYASISGSFGKLSLQAGVKYFDMREPKSEGYITKYTSNGTPYIDRYPLMDYGDRRYTHWSPSFGISYLFKPEFEAYLSAGRTFQRPYMYMPIINLYTRLYDKFAKLGISLSDLFKDYKSEETDNLDIGLRIRTEHFDLFPVVYFQRHRHLNTPVTPGWRDPDDPKKPLIDPSTGRPVSFNTFVGKAKGYGFELGSFFRITNYFYFFFNPSYVRLTYDGDITSQGTTYSVDGKQVVNVPKWSINAGAMLNYKGFEISPIYRYVGSSYGDLSTNEKIPSYSVWDLNISYNKENLGMLKDLRISLNFYNIFDKKYIIPGYYFGAPFTVIGSIEFKF